MERSMNKLRSISFIVLFNYLFASDLMLVTGGVSSSQNMLHLHNLRTEHGSILGDSLVSTEHNFGFLSVAIQPREWLAIGAEWYQEVSDYELLGTYIPVGDRFANPNIKPNAAILDSQALVKPKYGLYAQAAYKNLYAGFIAKEVTTEFILETESLFLPITASFDFKPESQWTTAMKLGYAYEVTSLLDAVVEVQKTLMPAEIVEHKNDPLNSQLYGDKIELSSIDIKLGARLKFG